MPSQAVGGKIVVGVSGSPTHCDGAPDSYRCVAHAMHDALVIVMLQRDVTNGGIEVRAHRPTGAQLPSLTVPPNAEQGGLHQILRHLAVVDDPEGVAAECRMTRSKRRAKVISSPARICPTIRRSPSTSASEGWPSPDGWPCRSQPSGNDALLVMDSCDPVQASKVRSVARDARAPAVSLSVCRRQLLYDRPSVRRWRQAK